MIQIIAEIGVNHNGSLKLAKRLIDDAKSSGANTVKFQFYNTERLVLEKTSKAKYQESLDFESQFQMLKKYELSIDDICELRNYSKKKDIEFLVSVFDIENLELLKKNNYKWVKIPSGEITNIPLLKKVKELDFNCLLSIGMASEDEILVAINILGSSLNTLMHCVSEYPTPYKNVNLNYIKKLRKLFDGNIGLSDHSMGIEVSLASIPLGVKVIEKHFTHDKKAKGPDHKASIDKDELLKLTTWSQNIFVALGDDDRVISQNEAENSKVVRKYIVASQEIKIGEKFSEKNISLMRSGEGIPAQKYYDLIGKNSKNAYHKKDVIFNE